MRGKRVSEGMGRKISFDGEMLKGLVKNISYHPWGDATPFFCDKDRFASGGLRADFLSESKVVFEAFCSYASDGNFTDFFSFSCNREAFLVEMKIREFQIGYLRDTKSTGIHEEKKASISFLLRGGIW
jgi:hypothetical protein